VFFTKTRATKSSSADVSARARAAGQAAQVAAQNAQVAAQSAAQNAAVAARTAATAAQATAQTAATGVSSGVQQGVYTARRWTAPRLELAADHVTKTVAPSVSSALRSTARQVRPAEPAKRRSALAWSLLGAAIVATAGAAFALIRYQFRAATADETVEVGETTDVSGKPTAATPAGPATAAAPNGASGTSGTSTPSGPSASTAKTTASKTAASKTAPGKTADDATATTTDTSVNGHVTSSGW
jgi:trimeric autotransporter adhesin